MDVVTADVIGDIALVLGASYVFGALARRVGQPTVVGQIVAGIALGPSLLGRFPGHLSHRLFTTDAVPFLSVVAQIAVVVFMFGVGYEIEPRSVRNNRKPVLLIALGAMVVPLALGSAVALGVEHVGTFDGHHTVGRSFLLYMGVATSITALPVLAAIVRERGLAGSVVGDVATAAAGLMDVVAWLVLAVALIGTKAAGSRSWSQTVLLLVVFVAVMFLVVRPALQWWNRRPGSVMASQVPIALLLATAGAWATADLGLHPIFGAFVAGLAMPKPDGAPDAEVLRSTEQTGGLLLPLFFVVTGLTVNIGALKGEDLALLAVILVCSIGGKFAAGYAAARLAGMDNRRSTMIGALVNTRGLTELIALNVGLRAGIIDSRLFTILVLMALITTAMTGPLITAIHKRDATALGIPDRAAATGALDPS
ncbi:cation:proton antiporter [Catenulispora rubra]|uniref:cation:proton antiporter n=1 Tax=Catenulispora rubra TaxID=280293 RepID=UPI0018921112|nr:cation:proton antiporter [Catenulispora rubra]